MRDYLLLYLNGKQVRVSGNDAFMPLSTYLRQERAATGTKVVCEEGDCGACSVMLGKLEDGELHYNVVNSCIQFLYQLDCTHVVTIEGLRSGADLNPVQEAMVACHGAQCGYCTPGFVVAMCGMFDRKQPVCSQEIKDGLVGNLCRCTGYEPIIKAGLAVDVSQMTSLHELYPSKEMMESLTAHVDQPVQIQTPDHTFFNPVTVPEACRFKGENASTVIVAGGTDVSVFWNKRRVEPRFLMSVSHLPGMRELHIENNTMVVGGRITLSEIESFVKDKIPQFANMMWLFGSPQIRNAGTMAGNIANASPIADTPPFLCVMDAELELTSVAGTRRLNINQFYKGYKQMDLRADELITRIFIPMLGQSEILRLYKVSRRRHLDISAFSAAFRLQLSGQANGNGHPAKGDGNGSSASGDIITSISIAYGGVAATIRRLTATENFLQGKPLNLQIMAQAAKIATSEITPISDVRGSKEFRNTLAENILYKLYYETAAEREIACR